MKKRLLLGLFACGALLSGCSSTKTVDMNDYIAVSYSGYDTAGKAACSFDSEKFTEDYSKVILEHAEKIGFKCEENTISYDTFLDFYDEDEQQEACMDYIKDYLIDVSAEPYDNLQNGDTITVTYTDNPSLLEEYGIKLKATSDSFTVEDLEEADTIDAFGDLTVEYEGYSPYASVKEIDSRVIGGATIYYSCSPEESLTKGDIVTVSAYTEDEGVILKEATKEYTVDQVGYYVSSLNEISEDTMTQMKSQAEDVILAYKATFEEDDTFKKYTYLGNYFLHAKDPDEGDNIIYLVYQFNVTNKAGDRTFFTYISFDTICCSSTGDCIVDVNEYRSPCDGGFFAPRTSSIGNYYYYGYDSLDDMFEECVLQNVDDYQYETTVEQ